MLTHRPPIQAFRLWRCWKKSPGVTVDNDGNISLKGKQGVMILLMETSLPEWQETLPTTLRTCRQINLTRSKSCLQPPAKYDASGNSGIINFKTKKSSANGFNANFQLVPSLQNILKAPAILISTGERERPTFTATMAISHWEGFNDITINRSLRESRSQRI